MTESPPVIGLRREREVLTVALRTNRHVVLEGPPGTGKSTLLRSIAAEVGQEVVFVEGNAELTPARLIGQYDPAAVLAEGYVPGSFTDGPLLTAMRGSGLLYLEELNRIPEETLNVLITVLTEGEITVARFGHVRAAAGFRLIAAMNPFDAVGTARVAQAIADRMCRVVLGYQDAAGERAIVAAVTGVRPELIGLAVRLVRATREHRDVRMGSSVRGAIDLVLLLGGLLEVRGAADLTAPVARETTRDAAHAALSGRIRLTEGIDRTPESVIDEILDAVWPEGTPPPEREHPDPTGADGPGKAEGPPPAGPDSASALRRDRRAGGWPAPGQPARAGRPARVVRRGQPAGRGAGRGRVRRAAGRRPGRRGRAGERPGPGHRPGPARGRAAAGGPGVRPGGPGRPAPGPGEPGGWSRSAAATATSTWTARSTRWTGATPVAAEDLVTRGWTGHRRAVCLAVDSSGSMTGLAVAIAAVAAAGVVLRRDERLETSVLTFGRDVEVVAGHARRPAAEAVVRQLLGLRGHGLTDVAAALRAARVELLSAVADQRVVVLLSDCLHTTGDPPDVGAGRHRPAARALPAADPGGRGGGPARWPPAAAARRGWSARSGTSPRR